MSDASEHSDPRDDPMGPPKEPCECWCMHCNRTFMSSEMWFQRVIGDPHGFEGFWMCPTPNCSGAGFCFDIFPTDPDHPANEGWHFDDGDEDEECDEELFDDDDDDDADAGAGADDEFDPEQDLTGSADDSAATRDDSWDPDETKWKQLDEELAGYEDEDDMEGEEWKHGLQPGERPPDPEWVERARREREEEEKQYDEPDRRPREVDWSDREDRRGQHPAGEGPITEDDIPF